MKIISIILIASACSSLTFSMQPIQDQSNFNAPPGVTVHIPRKNSLLSALAAKLSLESEDDTAAAQLKASKKRAKKNKKIQGLRSWNEYLKEQVDMSACLRNPHKCKVKYLMPESLLNM